MYFLLVLPFFLLCFRRVLCLRSFLSFPISCGRALGGVHTCMRMRVDPACLLGKLSTSLMVVALRPSVLLTEQRMK